MATEEVGCQGGRDASEVQLPNLFSSHVRKIYGRCSLYVALTSETLVCHIFARKSEILRFPS